MKAYSRCFALLIASFALLLPTIASAKETPDEERTDIKNTSADILGKLYTAEPSLKAALAKAGGGYATFRDFGMKIVFFGGGTGKGLVHNNKTGTDTYMKMVEAQAGLGLGAKKFSVVFIFETQDVLNNFIQKGWVFGGEATAAAKDGEKGAAYQGATAVADGIWMYQLTDTGLMADITVKGTKYYQDDDLN